MNCTQAQENIGAMVDEEASALPRLLLKRHMRSCLACTARHEALLALRARIRTELPRFSAPAALQARAEASLERIAGYAPAPRNAARQRWRWFASGALAGCAALLALLVAGDALMRWHASEDIVAQAVTGHVQASQANRLIEVASSDQHTVKPWLSARLDFAPPVRDLAAAGFVLLGARIESLHGDPAAVLVYRFRQHVIDVFVQPEAAPGPSSVRTLRGFHVVHASGSQMAFLAVSDLSTDVLVPFVQALAQGGENAEGERRP